MKKILENLAKLIDVKSIITISLVSVFCYLTVASKDIPQFFSSILTVVLSFYFGTQYQKKLTENTEQKGDDQNVS